MIYLNRGDGTNINLYPYSSCTGCCVSCILTSVGNSTGYGFNIDNYTTAMRTRKRGRTPFIFLKVIKLKCRLIKVFYLTNETGWLNV